MRKAIAIDFDGCLCTDVFPAIGEPNWPVIYRAKAEQQAGAGLILWTCREGQILQDAVAACESWGLTFDAVNESLPDWIEAFGNRPRKVGASEYWDDKAARIPVARRFFVGGPGDGSIELFEPNFGHKNMELNPCPFCGNTRIFYERYRSLAGERWRCWCTECLAGIDPGTAQEVGQVREMWNRRPVLPLTLEQLRKMDGEPVWLVGVSSVNNFKGHWDICSLESGDSPVFPYCGEDPDINLYGITWKAYRRRPEEGEGYGD